MYVHISSLNLTGMYACNSSLIYLYSVELSAVYMLITSLIIKLILPCIVVVAVTLKHTA